jgi:hypothetical protein
MKTLYAPGVHMNDKQASGAGYLTNASRGVISRPWMDCKRKTRTAILGIAIFGFAALLGACGGGGGGGGGGAGDATTPPPALSVAYPLKDAYVNYITSAKSMPFTITAADGGTTGAGTLNEIALTSTSFEGMPALKKLTTVTGSITRNGVTTALSVSGESYVDSAYTPLGDAINAYGFVSGAVTIPTTATVGSAGAWYTENLYTSSSKAALVGTATVMYSIQADPSSSETVLLKIIKVIEDTNKVQTVTSATFRMTSTGALTRLSEIAVSNGQTLVLTYY